MFDPMFIVACSTPAELPTPRERVVRRVLDGCGPAFWGWPYIPELVQPVRLPRGGKAEQPQVWTTEDDAPAPVMVTQCGICGSPVAGVETTYDDPEPWGDDRLYINPSPIRDVDLSPCGHGTTTPREQDVPVFAWVFLREQEIPAVESVPALVDWLTVWAAYYHRTTTTGAWDVADFARPPPLFGIDMTGPAVLRPEWNDDDDK